jgi:hypothetical protein
MVIGDARRFSTSQGLCGLDKEWLDRGGCGVGPPRSGPTGVCPGRRLPGLVGGGPPACRHVRLGRDRHAVRMASAKVSSAARSLTRFLCRTGRRGARRPCAFLSDTLAALPCRGERWELRRRPGRRRRAVKASAGRSRVRRRSVAMDALGGQGRSRVPWLPGRQSSSTAFTLAASAHRSRADVCCPPPSGRSGRAGGLSTKAGEVRVPVNARSNLSVGFPSAGPRSS